VSCHSDKAIKMSAETSGLRLFRMTSYIVFCHSDIPKSRERNERRGIFLLGVRIVKILSRSFGTMVVQKDNKVHNDEIQCHSDKGLKARRGIFLLGVRIVKILSRSLGTTLVQNDKLYCVLSFRQRAETPEVSGEESFC